MIGGDHATAGTRTVRGSAQVAGGGSYVIDADAAAIATGWYAT